MQKIVVYLPSQLKGKINASRRPRQKACSPPALSVGSAERGPTGLWEGARVSIWASGTGWCFVCQLFITFGSWNGEDG